MKKRLIENLQAIRTKGNYREVRHLKPLSVSRVLYNGKSFLNLCSNSYLSLHAHPDVVAAARRAVDEYGAGTCSSRSVSGSLDIHAELEREIAAFKGYPGALMFSNGYMANMGIIPTLSEPGDVIFSDELNHSSIIDATRLSRAKKVIYRHFDMEDLERKLKSDRSRGKRFIVTETVFSMDGDVPPLTSIVELKERYGCRLVLDEAHATGVFGETGRGVEEMFGLTGRSDVQMCTLGKSFGTFGAFALASDVVLEYLVNRARTFLYTTALPASPLAGGLAALRLVRRDPSIREQLWANITYMRDALVSAGFNLEASQGPIVPIIVGPDAKTMEMHRMLLEKGIFLQAIRPPTVPAGTSRLRLTIVRGFSRADMDEALDALIATGKKAGIIA